MAASTNAYCCRWLCHPPRRDLRPTSFLCPSRPAPPCLPGRFNERLVLSLASCQNCILMDDELNILPTSTHVSSCSVLIGLALGSTLGKPLSSRCTAQQACNQLSLQLDGPPAWIQFCLG